MLLNVALHGLEEAAGVRYRASAATPRGRRPGPRLLSAMPTIFSPCATAVSRPSRSRRGWPPGWRPRGLAFNEDKTRIVHLDEGCDFLGFNVRRYRGKLLIKPSKAAVRRIRQRLAAEMRALRGATPSGDHASSTRSSGAGRPITGTGSPAGVQRAGPPRVEAHLQVGQAPPSEQVETLDRRPVLRPFNPARRDRWVFGDRDSGAYLPSSPGPRSSGTSGHAARRPRRPGPDRLLGRRGDAQHPPLAPAHLRLLQAQARTLPALRGPAAARRPRAAKPARMGTVAPGTRKAIANSTIATRGDTARRTTSVSYTPTATAARRRQP